MKLFRLLYSRILESLAKLPDILAVLYSETEELSAEMYHLSVAAFVNQLFALKTFFI